MTLYVEGGVCLLLQHSHRYWYALALLLIVGGTLVISVDARGLAAVGWVIVCILADLHPHNRYHPECCFSPAANKRTAHLPGLSGIARLKSLDLLAAEEEGACFILNEGNCCYSVNQSDEVREWINTFHELACKIWLPGQILILESDCVLLRPHGLCVSLTSHLYSHSNDCSVSWDFFQAILSWPNGQWARWSWENFLRSITSLRPCLGPQS